MEHRPAVGHRDLERVTVWQHQNPVTRLHPLGQLVVTVEPVLVFAGHETRQDVRRETDRREPGCELLAARGAESVQRSQRALQSRVEEHVERIDDRAPLALTVEVDRQLFRESRRAPLAHAALNRSLERSQAHAVLDRGVVVLDEIAQRTKSGTNGLVSVSFFE